MKLNQIALAVAASLAAGSSFAALSAGEQTLLNDANSNGRVVFISGASAVQGGFTQIISTMFTGTPVRFANTTASSKDYEAVAGVLAAGTGPWAGQNAIVIYRTKGGSVQGVNPVARAETIESLNVTAAACGAVGAGTAASPYTCTLNTRTPDAGVSDVAPFLFKAPVNTEGEVAAASLTDAELADLAATPIYGLAFGVPVTSNVNAGVKFTRSAVAAIMTGNVGTWNQVSDLMDTNADPLISEGDDIVICRRVPGSGTQAVMNLWAGNFPCNDTLSNVPADRDASGAWDRNLAFSWTDTSVTPNKTYTGVGQYTVTAGTGGLVVVENSTSGDVRNCLSKAVSGGKFVTKDRDGATVLVDMGTGGHKAIGVLSMDSLSSSTTSGNWQFRSLDGAGKIVWDSTSVAVSTSGTGKFPTKEAYENGDWDLQGWISFNVPSRTAADANKAPLLTKFVENAQDPAILAASSSLKNVAMGIPGGLYTGAQVLDAAYLNGNQCAPFNRNYND